MRMPDVYVVKTEREREKVPYSTVCSTGRQRKELGKLEQGAAISFVSYFMYEPCFCFVLHTRCWELHALGCRISDKEVDSISGVPREIFEESTIELNGEDKNISDSLITQIREPHTMKLCLLLIAVRVVCSSWMVLEAPERLFSETYAGRKTLLQQQLYPLL